MTTIPNAVTLRRHCVLLLHGTAGRSWMIVATM
jgi:hypothetical protein